MTTGPIAPRMVSCCIKGKLPFWLRNEDRSTTCSQQSYTFAKGNLLTNSPFRNMRKNDSIPPSKQTFSQIPRKTCWDLAFCKLQTKMGKSHDCLAQLLYQLKYMVYQEFWRMVETIQLKWLKLQDADKNFTVIQSPKQA